ncbi:MAG: glyoxylate/hydroxypyruvate reductase A [Proteobacteria bacterium]|nr:glyoxylate/hydroxypyruvate reductase A [Desulfobacula sp.]MBU3951273.1 glyoxylate/hydroxypyruvate reductase A [Pseudomonadota bacterium]MBU4129990.1 glyoxylate/hydroxypyruvate reductase A [Pseudomonadota bacterium]
MAITFICPQRDTTPWVKALNALDPQLDIRVWPHDHPKQAIELALTWAHPPGVLREYPNLSCICSMGAGIDHLLADPLLPDPSLPGNPEIVRLVDRELIRSMSEYLLLAVLYHFRQFDVYQTRKQHKDWHPLLPPEKEACTIGIMGMGQLGGAAAITLSAAGFNVCGWRNSPEKKQGIPSFHGRDQLDDFLSLSRILICLLPLTQKTRHILNLDTFSKLPPNAYLINVGRGGHLKEPDLLTALDAGHLSGACLDVFQTEPLPADHPFWQHPKIMVTPHISSQTDPISVAPQILENLARLRTGKPLLNRVNIKKEY